LFGGFREAVLRVWRRRVSRFCDTYQGTRTAPTQVFRGQAPKPFHYAGHGVMGAAAGCAYGRHRANQQAQQQQGQPRNQSSGQAK
jgi:hypothetical protein